MLHVVDYKPVLYAADMRIVNVYTYKSIFFSNVTYHITLTKNVVISYVIFGL